MKFRFIDEQRRYHSVGKMAGLLGVSRAGYYAWGHRGESARATDDERLVEHIRAIQNRVKHRYGAGTDKSGRIFSGNSVRLEEEKTTDRLVADLSNEGEDDTDADTTRDSDPAQGGA